MNDFQFEVELVSPLLLGGADGKAADGMACIRGSAVRGLMRTFTRALIAPWLEQKHGDWGDLFALENELLGAAAGAAEGGSTYRVADRANTDLSTGVFDVRTSAGALSGFHPAPNGRRMLAFRPRSSKQIDAMALAAVAWTGLTFGSLGKRSRRGFGSLAVTKIEGLAGFPWPSRAPELEKLNHRALSPWPATGLPKELAAYLREGLGLAAAALQSWVRARGIRLLTVPRTPPYSFFQIAGAERVYLGVVARPDWKAAINEVMGCCHSLLGANLSGYGPELGQIKPRRLASPLWIRLVPAQGGVLPLAVFSPRPHPKTGLPLESIGNQLLANLGMKPITSFP